MIAAANPAWAERRCGWFENLTPANAWLTDKDGQWVISSQGGDSEDVGPWPSFEDKDWVLTNAGSYGYGCACLDVVTDAQGAILKIRQSKALPLKTCRDDKMLTEPENPLDDEIPAPAPEP